jgi:carboxypeptidase C (cathepsin A)
MSWRLFTKMCLGDADWICNWFGNLAAANAITYSSSAAFNAAAVKNYTVNGVSAGTYKTAGNLSWLRVFGAGHEVPYYREFTRWCRCFDTDWSRTCTGFASLQADYE